MLSSASGEEPNGSSSASRTVDEDGIKSPAIIHPPRPSVEDAPSSDLDINFASSGHDGELRSHRRSVSDVGQSSNVGSASGKHGEILKPFHHLPPIFQPRPRALTNKNTASNADEQSFASDELYFQRRDTVKLWKRQPSEPFTYKLSPEEEQASILTKFIRLCRSTVQRPSPIISQVEDGDDVEDEDDDVYMKQYARYFIRMRRMERFCLEFFYGNANLCPKCSELDLNAAKFLINSRENTGGWRGRSKFEPGTAAGRVCLGSMRLLVYKASICHLCRLIENALAEQQGFQGWLEYDFVSANWMTTDRENQLAAISCWLSWEIDGRDSRPSQSHAEPEEPLSRSRVPPGRTRRIRVEWETRQDVTPPEGTSRKPETQEIVPAYLVLLARPAGLRGSDAAFLGQHITTRVASVSLIDSWLKQCSKNHNLTCNPTLNQSESFHEIFGQPYFSVIDVQEKRLVALPKGERYAAMSYTWGGYQFYNTLQSHVRDSQQSGYFDKLEKALPKVIRDALQLVSSLGLRYLWVDALCIIQDSEQSWNCNVKIIDQIYGNAYFTICAADGASPNVGLVGMDEEARQLSQNTEQVADGVHLMVTYPAESYIRRSLWDTRAWTFQERLLSQRCIIFVEGRVFFQCRGGVQREDILTEETNGWSIEHQETPLKLLGVVLNRPLHAYMECVRLYTQRTLTKTDDMLNAFKGVGNFLSYIMGKKGLLFGLPRSHFDWALLWQMTPGENVMYRGKQRQRPSLKNIQQDFESMVELLDKNLVDQHGDHFQMVRDALKSCFDAQRKKERQKRRRSKGKDSGKPPHENAAASTSLYSQSLMKDMPSAFPSWSWCGWAGSYSQYYSHMLYGITSNVQHWLRHRTWITWYTRDREGRLKLVWEPDSSAEKKYPNPYDLKGMKVERRWHGYSRDSENPVAGEDEYGRPEADRWPERPPAEFKKTLKEFPFLNVHHRAGSGSSDDGDDDLRFLQFFTWSGRFRLQSFESAADERFADGQDEVQEAAQQQQQRYAILDYKDDICGVITPDRTGRWQWGNEEADAVSLEMGRESVCEFLAVSEAKEFSQQECYGWREYRQDEAQDWDLFYVMLVVEVEEVHYRLGLGKVTKEAFQNCCEKSCEWKEIILG